MSRRLTIAALVACMAYVAPAAAQEDEPTLGSEFLDMPEDEAAGEAEAPPEVKDEKEAPGYVPGYRKSPCLSDTIASKVFIKEIQGEQ